MRVYIYVLTAAAYYTGLIDCISIMREFVYERNQAEMQGQIKEWLHSNFLCIYLEGKIRAKFANSCAKDLSRIMLSFVVSNFATSFAAEFCTPCKQEACISQGPFLFPFRMNPNCLFSLNTNNNGTAAAHHLSMVRWAERFLRT